jgi:transketolase
MAKRTIDELCVDAIRILAVDMVEEAKSGHPGMPLGAAPMAYVLWKKFLKHNPKNPTWPDRDRFVLSAGHGSALLYSLLHVFGYDLSIDELKKFRQLGSKTPGHPEFGHPAGVEATTGPLGQGFAMGVGMALAERFLAARFNRPDFEIINHYTYAIVSDGDLMEGISSEAASFAGHQRLGKLVYLYDDNHMSIEGETSLAFTEDVLKRFEAYRWHVQKVVDGNDLKAIEKAIEKARAQEDRPSLIAVRTHLGYGSPRMDDAAVHGSPLGAEALKETKKFFGFEGDKSFVIREEVMSHLEKAIEDGRKFSAKWQRLFTSYGEKFSEQKKLFEREIAGAFYADWDVDVPVFGKEGKIATRSASGKVLNAISGRVKNLMGGSADLAPSNNTTIEGEGWQSGESPSGRNIHFGVREHSMAAIINGLALHGGVIPYCATFLIFSDYMRPAIRIAALMNVHSIFIFTHDSIGLGEDGPTHQPIEQLMSLRLIPNLTVIRPADANETAEAWRIAIKKNGPVAMALSRQNLPVLDVDEYPVRGGVVRGAYVLKCDGDPEFIIMASGSEVSLALEVARLIGEKGKRVRVVSMPSFEIFREEDESYRHSVFPPSVKKRVAIEAGVPYGWKEWVGNEGLVFGMTNFGASAPATDVFFKYGLDALSISESIIQKFDKGTTENFEQGKS